MTLRLALSMLLACVFLAFSVASASADNFTRLFPELPGYTAPDDVTLDALTAGAGPPPGPLFDPNADADDNPSRDLSFNTYFGQSVDHDTTLDLNPASTLGQQIDPTTLNNFRTSKLDLDSVYGGPWGSKDPKLFEADGVHFKLGTQGRDLPRDPATGFAVIGEGRNDENQIIAQIHVAFLRAHNALIDKGLSFRRARRKLTWRYQWIVTHAFLGAVLNDDVYRSIFRGGSIRTPDVSRAVRGSMPVEFSVAAYRFGHSMVRRAYALNCPKAGEALNRPQVFNPANPAADLHGGRPITPDRFICWANFTDFDGFPQPVQPQLNVSRKIDALLSSGLFGLPIPGAANDGSSILARRNILRARSYAVPSGQDVARRLGNPVLSNAEIAAKIPRLASVTGPAYGGKLPLWLYVLAESEITENGGSLGATGSKVVGETIGSMLKDDENSYYNAGWEPRRGDYRPQDLFRDAGVAPTP